MLPNWLARRFEVASGQVRLSVIVPVHGGGNMLAASLRALRGSDLPAPSWELIVVDDASRDDSAAVAGNWADTVISLEGTPRGPAHARNRGAEAARGSILAFVDADVLVHPSTLRQLVEALDEEPGAAAVFGAYDQQPAARGLVSQYRNLLHHYVHATNEGDADTFWAGCGAIRRADFVAAGGFDARRYPRPQIEDIALGYRLRALGRRVLLRPDIQATHLKCWTLRGILRSDLFDRGVPWMHLLMEQRPTGTLNVRSRERILTALAGAFAVLLPAAALTGSAVVMVLASASVTTIVAANFPFYRWLGKIRGTWFALRAVPLHLLHYLLSAVAVVVAVTQRVTGMVRGGSPSDVTASIRRDVS